jgi:hypothetical protein
VITEANRSVTTLLLPIMIVSSRSPSPDPVTADLDESTVYKQGLGKGAATFARL